MQLSRRAVLSGLASASVSVGGCRPGSEEARPIEAQFVGQDPTRAHRLRDRTIPGSAPTGTQGESLRTQVLIVGGGAAGMAAAWRLQRGGVQDFVVLELETGTGGTARGGQHPRSAYPMGAHYLPTPPPRNRGLWTLLGDLGFVVGTQDGQPELDPRFLCHAPIERHKLDGVWSAGLYPSRGQSPDEEAQWERWRAHLRDLDGRIGSDGRRLFDLPVAQSSQELRHLDTVSAATYLDRLGLTSWRLRWAADYACRDDYGCRLHQTSAFALLHHELARGLEDTHDRFILTFPEGNARLVTAMAHAARVPERLRTSTLVHRIDPDSGLAHAWDLEHDTPLRVQADVIVWAAPRFVLRHVLPDGRDPLPAGAISYSPWLVANVQVRHTPGGFGAVPAWDNVAIGPDHLGYVRANHAEPLTQRYREGAVLTFYEPLTADNAAGLSAQRSRLLSGTLHDWTAHVVGALQQMHPTVGPDIERIDIARWGHAMVRPTPGWLFGPARATAAAAVGRVLPCAADVGGLPLFEQAYAGGVAAAEQALARLGRPTDTIL